MDGTNGKSTAESLVSAHRRQFLLQGVASAGMATVAGAGSLGISQSAWAAGSDKPELHEVRIGFIPLTDCAPIAVAAEMGFDRKYGIKIIPSREASWAGVRDKLSNGEIHAAQALYGLVYGVQLGIGCPQKDMAVLMSLNNNGQGITLSSQLRNLGVTDGTSLERLLSRRDEAYTFAQTFPTGTHAMWQYYWLGAFGINPLKDVKTITVPPPQMVANMRIGNMDGFCAGEPWNARAIFDNIGFSVATSQEIWMDHPEKVLGTTAEFVRQHPNTTRAMLMAVLEACRHIDVAANRPAVARLIAGKSYVNAPEAVIAGRFLGHYDNGIGRAWEDPNHIKFFNDGQVTFPYLSDAMWFMTQHRRWGLLKSDPDYLAVAGQVNQVELYREAAGALGISMPPDSIRTSRLMDGVLWDGQDPASYAAGFVVRG
ncbi:nitrate transport protein NrtA precursor [mine drainage metagenome]|uniref:Nitrate transport protein NrtA n=1 Tax=mine drainage metagenome TaxID=410659 RepID=A0A1J5QYJ6_9ZZZZ